MTSPSKMLRQAFDLFKKNWKKLIYLAGFGYLINSVFGSLISNNDSLMPPIAAILLSLFLSATIMSSYAFAASRVAIGEAAPDLQPAVYGGLVKLPAVVGLFFLMLIFCLPYIWVMGVLFFSVYAVGGGILGFGLAALGIVAVILSIVYFQIRLSQVLSAIYIDNLGPINAVKRSWTLTKNKFWLVFSYYALPIILIIAYGLMALSISRFGFYEGLIFVLISVLLVPVVMFVVQIYGFLLFESLRRKPLTVEPAAHEEGK